MNVDREVILKIATVIKNSKEPNKEEHFKVKYKNFATKYPMLFQMCCKDDFDYDRLCYMLNMIKNVSDNKLSYEDASKQVGQKMYDEYVDPLIKQQEKNNTNEL